MLGVIGRVIIKSFDYEGRSSRRELIYFLALSCILWTLKIALGLKSEWVSGLSSYASLLHGVLVIITVPWIALMVRRLHDIGCSAWVSLAWLVPISGSVIQVWMLLDKGDPEENYYGPPPRD